MKRTDAYQATGDVVARMDAAIDQVCACGCRLALGPDGPSAWFATQDCQRRWTEQNHADDPHDVYARYDAHLGYIPPAEPTPAQAAWARNDYAHAQQEAAIRVHARRGRAYRHRPLDDDRWVDAGYCTEDGLTREASEYASGNWARDYVARLNRTRQRTTSRLLQARLDELRDEVMAAMAQQGSADPREQWAALARVAHDVGYDVEVRWEADVDIETISYYDQAGPSRVLPMSTRYTATIRDPYGVEVGRMTEQAGQAVVSWAVRDA